MAEPGGSGLDILWQGLTAAGVFVGGVIAALLGFRKKNDATADQSAGLRSQLALAEMRRDLVEAFQAHREAMEERMRDFEGGMHDKVDALSEERRRSIRELEERVRDLEVRRGR